VCPDAGVSLIIPALNEEGSLGRVLDAVPAGIVDEIIVVDGGSSDDTVALAHAHGCRVVEEPRRGYGRACATGAAAARGEVLLFMDADGADDPTYLPPLLAPLRNGEAGLALGSRLAGQRAGRAMPWLQRVGNRVSAWLIRRLYGLPLTDLSPMRAVRRDALEGLDMREMTYGWPTEMIVKAVRRGWRVVEVPLIYRQRFAGRSKISGTVKGTLLATWNILTIIVRHARLDDGRRHATPAGARACTCGARVACSCLAGGRRPVIAIMAREPVAGSTKTRLCPPLTPAEAAALYEALLRDTIALVAGLQDVQLAVAVSPPEGVPAVAALCPPAALLLPVAGRDIGDCLQQVLGQLFQAGYRAAIALNSDGPTLPAAYLCAAVDRLADADVVLGPSHDGGYYLIGMARPTPGLFRGIDWSTSRVTAQTLARAESLGLRVALLPPWYDVDTPADLARLRAEVDGLSPDVLVHTRRFLAGHPLLQ